MSQHRRPLPESPLCLTQRFPQASSRRTHFGPTPPPQTSLQTWEERLPGLWVNTQDLPNSPVTYNISCPLSGPSFLFFFLVLVLLAWEWEMTASSPAPPGLAEKGLGEGRPYMGQSSWGWCSSQGDCRQECLGSCERHRLGRVSQGRQYSLQVAGTCSPRPRQNSRAVRKPVWAWSRLSNTASNCSGVRGRSLCRP